MKILTQNIIPLIGVSMGLACDGFGSAKPLESFIDVSYHDSFLEVRISPEGGRNLFQVGTVYDFAAE